MDLKPCRSLFHITPVIPNRHSTLAQRAVLWVVVVQIYKRALRAGA